MAVAVGLEELLTINCAGPPWFDDVAKEVLPPLLVEAGMENERLNLNNFKVFVPATWEDQWATGGRAV